MTDLPQQNSKPVWLSHHVGDTTHGTHPDPIDSSLVPDIHPQSSPASTPPSPKKPNVIPMLAVMMLLMAGVIGGMTLMNNNQDVRSKAAANETNITLSKPTDPQPGATYRVPVTLSSTTTASQTRTIAAVDIAVTYPTNLLTFQAFEPTMFPAAAPQATSERLAKTEATNGTVRILEGAACTAQAPWSCGVPTVGTGKTLGTLVFTVNSGAAGQTGTFSVNKDATIIASTNPLDVNVHSGNVSSFSFTVAGATTSNARDITGPTAGVPDGKVNALDLGYILQNPFPCGNGYADTCPTATVTKRDVSGVTRGTADGKVNSIDSGYVLQNPYPCGSGYAAACQ